ncbi:hypothetical protein IWW50_004443 [Coemansia erecta]|nr:hypothetical protein GGF43_003623 [Coemansia sp. RSA 2618]KAJ2821901.1 hypothetical protein IWW50_004443 [Coemansia erecta]
MMEIKKQNLVCVFCSSRDGNNPVYLEAAASLGRALVASGYGLVFGGSNIGLMGQIARSVHASNGEVVGIMVRVFMDMEGCADKIGHTVVVDDVPEGRVMMNDLACAFITLPGGFATLDELLDIASWSMRSIHSKPVIVLNTNGYYDALRGMLTSAVDAGFIPEENKNIIMFCDTPEEAVKAIATYCASS